MHLDDEQIERLRHRELGGDAERGVREHLAECEACRAAIAIAKSEEAELYGLLRALDHEPPRIDADTIAARARRVHSAPMRWAAGLVLAAVVGSAAIAAPWSPLRGWLGPALDWVTPRSVSTDRQAAQPAQPSVAGVAVDPGQELQILFTADQSIGDARISLTSDAEVVVSTATGAARFTSDARRIVIDNKGSVSPFEIRIPRGAPRVEILVQGVRVFLKEKERVTVAQPADKTGIYAVSIRR